MAERTTSDIREAFEIGSAQKVHDAGKGLCPVVVVPKGMELKPLELYQKPAPLADFTTAQAQLEDLDGFIAYTNRYKNDATLICVCANSELRACFDYHKPKGPGRNAHIAKYVLKPSEAYLAWTGINNKPLSQEAFAFFLEERGDEVVFPGSAEIMEIALTLEAKSEVQFTSGIRLNNGTQQLKWDESTVTKAGAKGEMEVPTQLKIEVPLFRYGQTVGIEAKLRTVVRDGGVTFTVKLLGLEKAMDEAVDKVIAIVSDETGIAPLRGSL